MSADPAASVVRSCAFFWRAGELRPPGRSGHSLNTVHPSFLDVVVPSRHRYCLVPLLRYCAGVSNSKITTNATTDDNGEKTPLFGLSDFELLQIVFLLASLGGLVSVQVAEAGRSSGMVRSIFLQRNHRASRRVIQGGCRHYIHELELLEFFDCQMIALRAPHGTVLHAFANSISEDENFQFGRLRLSNGDV